MPIKSCYIVLNETVISILTEADLVKIRQITKQLTVELEYRPVDQTKLITAVSELARNAIIHGGGGKAKVETISNNLKNGLCITFSDNGPGIDDPDNAMNNGYSTKGGLGLGLGGAKRLVDEFDIQTSKGHGTLVKIIKWK